MSNLGIIGDGSNGIKRRTVVKGAMWSVPVVVAAMAAPLAAASGKPFDPVIDFKNTCGNTGATQKGCGGSQTLQVGLTFTNQTGKALVFQITSMYTCNCATAPTASGAGVYTGVRGVWKTTGDHNACTAPASSTCTGGTPNGSIVVPNGTVGQKYWIESVPTGNSSGFSTTINWRMLDADTCAVVSAGTAQTASAISSGNC